MVYNEQRANQRAAVHSYHVQQQRNYTQGKQIQKNPKPPELLAGIGGKPGGAHRKGGAGTSDDNNAPWELIKSAGMLLYTMMTRYWVLVRPVFYANSALRIRFRTGRLTFNDSVLCILAGGFVVAVMLLAMVAYRVLVAFGTVLQLTASIFGTMLGM